MPRIVRDIQLLVNDDDDHLYGYRLSDGTEVRIGTSRPDNAAAVVGAAGGMRALYAEAPGTKTAIGSSAAEDFSETVLATITIPAGTLKTPGVLRISNFWQYTSGAASTKNFITKINSMSVNAPSTATAGNKSSLFDHHIELVTPTSQLANPSTQIGANSTSDPTALNLDINDDWVITFSARWSDTATDPSAGDVITLLGARVVF